MIDCPASAEAGHGDCLTVLVVEDEVLIRLDIAEELRQAGYEVLEAASGEDALRLLRTGRRVHAVFSDYQLLGAVDGWQLCARMRTSYPDIPFILTSAQTIRHEWRESGVIFVPKPYRPELVPGAIRRVTHND